MAQQDAAIENEEVFILRLLWHEAPPNLMHLLVHQIMIHEQDEEDEVAWHQLPYVRTIWSMRLAGRKLRAIVDEECRRMTWLGNEGVEHPVPAVLPQILNPGRWKGINIIQCAGANLQSLKGVPAGLYVLYVPGNKHIHSLEPLAACEHLDCVNISGSSVKNLGYLSRAEQLSELIIDECPVEDISILADSCLTVLSLNLCTGIRDLEPISTCSQMESLSFNQLVLVPSLSPLSSLVKLKKIECSGCSLIDSLDPIKDCLAMESLILEETMISDLSPLLRFLELQTLNIRNTLVSDIEPLRSLTKLHTLDIIGTLVTNIEPILDCQPLKDFSCDEEPIIASSSATVLVRFISHRLEVIRNVGRQGVFKKCSDDQDGSQVKVFVAAGVVQRLVGFIRDNEVAVEQRQRNEILFYKALAAIAEKGYRGVVGKSEGVLELLTKFLISRLPSIDNADFFHGEANEVLVAATKLVFDLSENQDQDIQMAAEPRLLHVIFDTWVKTKPFHFKTAPEGVEKILVYSISALANLSYRAANRKKITNIPDVIPKLMQVVLDGVSDSPFTTRAVSLPPALEALSFLTLSSKVCEMLGEDSCLPSFISKLKVSLVSTKIEDLDSADFAAQILINLIKAKESRLAILAHPSLQFPINIDSRLKPLITKLTETSEEPPDQAQTFSVCLLFIQLFSLLKDEKNESVKLRFLEVLSSVVPLSDSHIRKHLRYANFVSGMLQVADWTLADAKDISLQQAQLQWYNLIQRSTVLNLLSSSESESEEVRSICKWILDQIN